MVRCGFCQKEIENPREYKGEVIQKFCRDRCRYSFHNERKRKDLTLAKEMISIFKKSLSIEGTH
jgi:hypothetical protein